MEDEGCDRPDLGRPASPSKSSIEYDKSTYSVSVAPRVRDCLSLILSIPQLQQEAHVAQAKVAEQQIEIEKLKRELALRPINVNEKISELQLEVDQLTEMTREAFKDFWVWKGPTG